MYEEFYGFRTRPFSILPDAEFLYLSRGHRLALSLLEYGLGDQTGYTVITGEIGSGKTTLVSHLLANSGAEHTIGYITNTAELNNDLMRWVLFAFDLPVESDDGIVLYKALVAHLKQEYAQGRNCVLIIDEAQHLSPETLENLRLLSNVNIGKTHLFQLILVGQPELLETLQRPDLVQFSQRISANFHLEALSLLDTREYIGTRLSVAGAVPTLFDDLACDLVYLVSEGIPRQINILCDTALIYGFAESQYHIDIDTIIAVLRDRATAQRLSATPKLEELERPLLEERIREVRKREFSEEADRGLTSSSSTSSSPEEVGAVEPEQRPAPKESGVPSGEMSTEETTDRAFRDEEGERSEPRFFDAGSEQTETPSAAPGPPVEEKKQVRSRKKSAGRAKRAKTNGAKMARAGSSPVKSPSNGEAPALAGSSADRATGEEAPAQNASASDKADLNKVDGDTADPPPASKAMALEVGAKSQAPRQLSQTSSERATPRRAEEPGERRVKAASKAEAMLRSVAVRRHEAGDAVAADKNDVRSEQSAPLSLEGLDKANPELQGRQSAFAIEPDIEEKPRRRHFWNRYVLFGIVFVLVFGGVIMAGAAQLGSLFTGN